MNPIRAKNTLRSILLLLASMLASISCLAKSPTAVKDSEQNPYLNAQFSFSSDSTKAVLTIITSGMSPPQRSLILYGDGRLELENNREGSWVSFVDIHEMESILNTAVSHGLAEWDGDTINAQMLRDHGKPFGGPVDGMNVHILLVLDEYERGSYKVDEVRRSISVASPRFYAEHFPKIPQFDGIMKVWSWMVEEMKQARDSER